MKLRSALLTAVIALGGCGPRPATEAEARWSDAQAKAFFNEKGCNAGAVKVRFQDWSLCLLVAHLRRLAFQARHSVRLSARSCQVRTDRYQSSGL